MSTPSLPSYHISNLASNQLSMPMSAYTGQINDANPMTSCFKDTLNLNESLIVNELIIEPTLWQVHNCKISTLEASQAHPLPFLYHYDTLSDELKEAHPLTADLLTQFNTVMSADTACKTLRLPIGSITTPWQVKVAGTLVIYSETLQLALRLRFTNTAKERDPIYLNTDNQGRDSKQKAIKIAMRDWHFFGEVFILNKQSRPVIIFCEAGVTPSYQYSARHDKDENRDEDKDKDNILNRDIVMEGSAIYTVPKLQDYQHIPQQYAAAILNELDTHKSALTYIDEAIQQRLE